MSFYAFNVIDSSKLIFKTYIYNTTYFKVSMKPTPYLLFMRTFLALKICHTDHSLHMTC